MNSAEDTQDFLSDLQTAISDGASDEWLAGFVRQHRDILAALAAQPAPVGAESIDTFEFTKRIDALYSMTGAARHAAEKQLIVWINAQRATVAAVEAPGPLVQDGYVLALESAVEMPDGKKELGYTLLDGLGIFTSQQEVYEAIAELSLPIGWVSMTTRQLLPGWMLPASAPIAEAPQASTAPVVALSDADILEIARSCQPSLVVENWTLAFARAIEQRLRAQPGDGDKLDANRYRWLCEELKSPNARDHRDYLLRNMSGKSYSENSREIDLVRSAK